MPRASYGLRVTAPPPPGEPASGIARDGATVRGTARGAYIGACNPIAAPGARWTRPAVPAERSNPRGCTALRSNAGELLPASIEPLCTPSSARRAGPDGIVRVAPERVTAVPAGAGANGRSVCER